MKGFGLKLIFRKQRLNDDEKQFQEAEKEWTAFLGIAELGLPNFSRLVPVEYQFPGGD